MRRVLLSLGAAMLVAGSAGVEAKTAARTTGEEDCAEYCAEKAAETCEDVSSSWCSVYIIGCLAGCGVSGC